MQTAGETLRLARIKAKLTLTQLSRLTKIPVPTLRHLEKNRFAKLPSATYIQGFIHNYARVVKLEPDKVVALFKRDFNRQKPKKVLPQGLTQPLEPSWLTSPLNRHLLAAALVVILLFIYLGLTLLKLFQPPQLILEKPQEGQEASSPLVLKGKTNPDATLILNGKTVNLEADGRFTTVYQGPPGSTELKLKATSRRGKVSELVRYVIIIE